jgi:Calx-beta domain
MKKILFSIFTVLLFACDDEPEQILFNGPHIVSFEIENGVAVESNDDPFAIPVSISRTFDQDVTVNFTVTEENAIEGIDYSITQSSVTIPAGQFRSSLLVQTINNDQFDLARKIVIELTNISESSLSLSEQKVVTLSILNDDCPVNTSIWAGNIAADEDGYAYVAEMTPNEAGDCDILLVGNIGDYGFLGTLKSVIMVFTPDSEGATTGTVTIAKQGLGIVSDGAGGFTGSGERSVEGSGTYDEETKLITIDLTFRFGSGTIWYQSTTVFDGN